MDEEPSGACPAVPDLLLRIDAELGEGIASPNHVLTVAPAFGPCPATEPQEVYEGIEPSPSVDVDNGGAGVLIYVADTGLLHGAGDHRLVARAVSGRSIRIRCTNRCRTALHRSRPTPDTAPSWPV